MFEKYDPRQGKMLRIMKEDGTLEGDIQGLPIMSDEELIRAYKLIVLARETDEWAVSLNRQGRLPTYAPNKGQEANTVGALMALRNDDWFVQAFRELGGLLVRNVPLRQYFLTWHGNEWGNHYPVEKYHILPVSVPIASQYMHAAGLAYAEMYKGTDRVVIAYVGDGGTSEGDFYEGINFAGAWNSPNIFYVQNNQWAISVPRHVQTACKTIAEKATAAGFEGVQIDGNDVMAVYAATKMAAEKARKGGGPTLIEGVTYRLGAHTTADDPTRYRDESEVQCWIPKEPLVRLEKHLKNKNLLNEQSVEQIKKEAKALAIAEFEAAEKSPDPTLDDTFKYMFKEMPTLLKDQLEAIKARRQAGGNK